MVSQFLIGPVENSFNIIFPIGEEIPVQHNEHGKGNGIGLSVAPSRDIFKERAPFICF